MCIVASILNIDFASTFSFFLPFNLQTVSRVIRIIEFVVRHKICLSEDQLQIEVKCHVISTAKTFKTTSKMNN